MDEYTSLEQQEKDCCAACLVGRQQPLHSSLQVIDVVRPEHHEADTGKEGQVIHPWAPASSFPLKRPASIVQSWSELPAWAPEW